MDILLTGERMTAQEALAIGLLSRVSSSRDTLVDEVRALALRIAAKPPMATMFVKQAARAASKIDLKSGLDLELELFSLLVPMRDVKEAALAFGEKRAPLFVGL
jgi:enoyl-CoA hydratase/carnithine racemase